jgi:membrane protease YdiL (CAAX protease family)
MCQHDIINVSKYHLWVILLYAVLIPLIFLVMPEVFQYRFTDTPLEIVIILFSLICLTLFVYFEKNKLRAKALKLTISKILLIFGYAALFAFPEEVLFRGVIQAMLSSFFNLPIFSILLSSVIFGIAHIYNGSTSSGPRGWNWKLVFAAFVGGLPLSLLFFLTGSLFWPTLLHAIYLITFQFFLATK